MKPTLMLSLGLAAGLLLAAAAFDASAVAHAAYGDDVVAHYLNAARIELAAFGTAVTDWERVLGLLAEREWAGPICLTAELSDAVTPDDVADVMRDDLVWAKQLWAAAR